MESITYKELVDKAVFVQEAGCFIIPADIGRLMVQDLEEQEAKIVALTSQVAAMALACDVICRIDVDMQREFRASNWAHLAVHVEDIIRVQDAFVNLPEAAKSLLAQVQARDALAFESEYLITSYADERLIGEIEKENPSFGGHFWAQRLSVKEAIAAYRKAKGG